MEQLVIGFSTMIWVSGTVSAFFYIRYIKAWRRGELK